jgi:hypothetical protein
MTRDYTKEDGILHDQTEAYARNSDTGEIDVSGDGQVNFTIVPKSGYVVDEVIVEPEGSFKNKKLPVDTGKENTYRITKIKGDLVVTITTKKSGSLEEATATPSASTKPTPTSAANPTRTPAISSKPTQTPTTKPAQTATEKPSYTPASNPTDKPKPTDEPKTTDNPNPTDAPKATDKPGDNNNSSGTTNSGSNNGTQATANPSAGSNQQANDGSQVSDGQTSDEQSSDGASTAKTSKKPGNIKKFKVKKNGSGIVLVSWKKAKNAKTYEIRYTTDKKFKKGVKKLVVKKTSSKIKKLKKGNRYYFKVRGKTGNKYGRYSVVKSIKL